MARRPVTDLAAWPCLTLEGGVVSPAMLALVAREQASEQTPADYGLRKGLALRDEISLAFRAGQAHWRDLAARENPTQRAMHRFAEALLRDAFGFDDLRPEALPLAFTAGEGRAPVVVVPPADALDRRSAALGGERPRSAANALQEHLNGHDGALWGLALNGTVIRLMRDNASFTRPAYIEADLARIFSDEDIASFSLLWLVIHRSRFGRAGQATDCPLERWREAGAKEGVEARNRLAGQVREALAVLGSGFLSANPALREKVWSADAERIGFFNELLRLVYRLIFLMVAEDRDLLHPRDADFQTRRLYEQGYSLTRLRELCQRRSAWDRRHDRYEGLRIVFLALSRGEKRLGLPALGGLFDMATLARIGDAKLPNRALMEALWRLAFLADGAGMAPVNWRAMETEELGSVYESLLELQPQSADGGRALAFAGETAEQKGNQRKTTGSYYTPDSLVQALLDTALDPVLAKAEEADDPAAALLALTVIDPACGSGHFLLAAARRIATRLARIRAGGSASAEDFRHALRDVARRCLHGVDRNPMAVELTKVALWIETIDPGMPLGFFDAQIRCGDSLFGVFDLAVLDDGIPDSAYKPLAGDDKETAKHYAARNKAEKRGQGSLDFSGGGGAMPAAPALAGAARAVRELPEDTLDQIHAKEKAYARLHDDRGWWRRKIACDLYCAAFLAPKTGGVPANRTAVTIPTTDHVRRALAGEQVYGPLQARADALAADARAFHWPLEFPDAMQRGGFDVVLGNPPWERIKLQEQEFFAARSPAIATAPNKAARDRLIRALAEAPEGTPDRALHDAFTQAKRLTEASSEFMRVPAEDGGRFPLSGRGDVNTYALFAELFARLTGPTGRSGVIVPTGIATDATTAPFFADLVSKQRLSQLVDFENRAGLFPAVDSRMKFCLLTLGRNEPLARFAFFLTEPAQLAEPERNFTLSPAQIARLNPNTRTAPVFRSRKDAELTARIYDAAPVLIEEAKGEEGNPWGMRFHSRIWHMAEDSEWFRTAAQLAAEGFTRDGPNWRRSGPAPTPPSETFVPLYEAKMIHHFDHRWATYAEDGISTSDFSILERQDQEREPTARYWLPENEVASRLSDNSWPFQWLIGWRDITNATNERTVISAVFPRSGSGDTILLMFPDATHLSALAGLSANLASMTLDYVARQKVGGTHLKFNVFFQLPILPPSFYTPEKLAFLTPRVLELTYTSHALAPFARDLGHDGTPFPWDEARRATLRADLDAFFARAYRLTRDDLRYILDPADVMGPDYPSETFRVLKEKETRLHGEYRTRRLVLDAWDRLERDGTFDAMGM